MTLKRSGLFTSLFLSLSFGLLVLGHWDAIEADASFSHYCEMVKAGAWPDYQNKGDLCETNNTTESHALDVGAAGSILSPLLTAAGTLPAVTRGNAAASQNTSSSTAVTVTARG